MPTPLEETILNKGPEYVRPVEYTHRRNWRELVGRWSTKGDKGRGYVNVHPDHLANRKGPIFLSLDVSGNAEGGFDEVNDHKGPARFLMNLEDAIDSRKKTDDPLDTQDLREELANKIIYNIGHYANKWDADYAEFASAAKVGACAGITNGVSKYIGKAMGWNMAGVKYLGWLLGGPTIPLIVGGAFLGWVGKKAYDEVKRWYHPQFENRLEENTGTKVEHNTTWITNYYDPKKPNGFLNYYDTIFYSREGDNLGRHSEEHVRNVLYSVPVSQGKIYFDIFVDIEYKQLVCDVTKLDNQNNPVGIHRKGPYLNTAEWALNVPVRAYREATKFEHFRRVRIDGPQY